MSATTTVTATTTTLTAAAAAAAATARKPLVVILAGPTASGKSNVAAILCQRHNGLIVSADSVQAYPHVQIGANKPTAMELQTTPHLLIDIATVSSSSSVSNVYSVNDWRRDAMYAIRQMINEPTNTKVDLDEHDDDEKDEHVNNDRMQRRHKLDATIQATREQKQQQQQLLPPADTTTTSSNNSNSRKATPHLLVPFVVGGSMMYVQWLVHGRPDAVRPTASAVQRAHEQLQRYQSTNDWRTAVATLVTPLGSPFVDQLEKISSGGQQEQQQRHDWYRLRRILEVAYTLQERTSDDRDTPTTRDEAVYSGIRTGGLLDNDNYDVRCFFLCPDDRMKHSKVVDRRCEDMIGRGLVSETTDLVLAGNMPDMVLRAIGYRQTLEYLQRDDPRNDDTESFDDYISQFTAATRQYSKKQMQWFRRDAEFTFVAVPLSVSETTERVQVVVDRIERLLQLSRDEYDCERQSPNSESAATRARNEAQAKGMKVYQLVKEVLLPGSKELANAIAEADSCTHRLQAKRPRKQS